MKPRPNSEGSKTRLDAARVLLSKAMVYVKEAKEELAAVRGLTLRGEAVDSILASLRDETAKVASLKSQALGLATYKETPEQEVRSGCPHGPPLPPGARCSLCEG